MSASKPDTQQARPFAFEDNSFLWNIRRVPATLPDGKTPHPGRTSAIFVVHGIGDQAATGTAAELRSGFEDAFEDIRRWQAKKEEKLRKKGKKGGAARAGAQLKGFDEDQLPSPFVYEGFWADFPDVAATFPEDWNKFNPREQTFFSRLWQRRVFSVPATAWWYMKQLWKLVMLRSFIKNPVLWFLCLPLVILLPLTMLIGMLRYPKLMSAYLADVRLYCDPRGDVERAIVQRIDKRVGARFLELLGLDWDFRKLPPKEDIEAGGERMTFTRVVWVAHSLGTVISYNVLASLFERARKIDEGDDQELKDNVKLFRTTLARFVTLGSPLDKVAYLFRSKALTPWQDTPCVTASLWSKETVTGIKEEVACLVGKQATSARAAARLKLVDGGEAEDPNAAPDQKEWWVNFYSVFDPVSGPLDDCFICGDQPPWNYSVYSLKSFVPGLSHVSYWSDMRVLKFILGRVYGCNYLPHGEYKTPYYRFVLCILRTVGRFAWLGILYGAVYMLYRYRLEIWDAVLKMAGKMFGS